MAPKKSTKARQDLDLYQAETERIDRVVFHLCTLARALISGGVVAYLIYTTNSYLHNQPEQISAVAKVISALKLEIIIPALATATSVGALIKERSAKQRAIQKAGQFRKQLEQGEPNRTSSGLTAVGTTPEDEY